MAMILSSSRMTILMMILGFMYLIILSLLGSVMKFKIRKRDIRILILLTIAIISIIIYIYRNLDTFKFLIKGLGILDTPAYSREDRENQAWYTFEVFLNSPFIGYSLGGIAPAIAKLKGFTIHTQDKAKNFEGMNIFLEVLAASGIIGFLFFVSYFVALYYKAIKIMKLLKTIGSVHSVFIGSLSFALFIELLILSMNQNILRPYLWVLLGMFSNSILIGKRILYEKKINNRL